MSVQVREFLAMLCYSQWLTGFTMKKTREHQNWQLLIVTVTPWNNVPDAVT
jgi:hypothetical protein